MLVWNPQLEHHLDTLDDKSTISNDYPQECQGSRKDDGPFQEDKATDSHFPRNKEKKQDIKDVSSRDWYPIVEWIGVGLIGCRLLYGSIAASVVLLLCTMAWLFQKRKISHFDTRMQQQEETRFLKCRIELSKLLGSVGAPPLQSTVTLLENTNATVDYKLVLDFGTAHVHFLREMDWSLHTLRTAVGMHLRTTPLSTDRVELAAVNRCRSKGSNATFLPTARRMFSSVVLDQYTSLRDCCASLSTFEANDNDGYCPIEVPAVITLSWLKSMRHELADLLSFHLSQLMSSQEILGDVSHPDSALQQRLCVSTSTAMELTEYLSSMFFLSPTIPKSLDVLPHALHPLYQKFDNASVAMWACQELCKENSDDVGAESNTTSVLEFLDEIECLLHSVGDVKERLEQNFYGTTSDGEVVETNEKIGESRDKSAREHTDPQDYEHSGQSFAAVSRNDTSDIVKNKTLVFSASGALQQQRISNNKGNGSTLTTIPSRKSITTQQVLQELQERLSKMDRAEEVSADGTRMDDLDTQRTVQKKALFTSSMLHGPSGDVLAELKNAIQNGEGWPLSMNA